MFLVGGVQFNNVLAASGVQGFFGEGYWFHKFLKPIGLNFKNMTFVSKTTTLYFREGNMPLTDRYTPREFFPDCIKAHPFKGTMLNAVGLSGPGLGALLELNQWQERTEPFFISLMPIFSTRLGRIEEMHKMIGKLQSCKQDFQAKFGLQINLSCPNTGHDPAMLMAESAELLNIAASLGVPVMPKFSIATAPIDAVMELNTNPHCHAICVSNTIPSGWENETIDWQRIWGGPVSPLERWGGGGLSGAPLRPLVCHWIQKLREAGFTKPINGGGGILQCSDVDAYKAAGANSVFLGSVAGMRPWRVKKIIRHANSLKWE